MKPVIKKIALVLVLLFVFLLIVDFCLIVFFRINVHQKYRLYQQSKTYYGAVDELMRQDMIPDAEFLQVENLRKIPKYDGYDEDTKKLEEIIDEVQTEVERSYDEKDNYVTSDKCMAYFEDKSLFSRVRFFILEYLSIDPVIIHTDTKAFVSCGASGISRIYLEKKNDKWLITDTFSHA